MIETKEETALNPAVGATGGQSIPCNELSIAEYSQNCNDNFSMERHWQALLLGYTRSFDRV